jgi:hypothetical protein
VCAQIGNIAKEAREDCLNEFKSLGIKYAKARPVVRPQTNEQTKKRHFRAVFGDVVALNGAHSRHRPHRRAPNDSVSGTGLRAR